MKKQLLRKLKKISDRELARLTKPQLRRKLMKMVKDHLDRPDKP